MLTGSIICSCGQLFGFTTSQETVECPMCDKSFVAAEYGKEEELVPEYPIFEEILTEGSGSDAT